MFPHFRESLLRLQSLPWRRIIDINPFIEQNFYSVVCSE